MSTLEKIRAELKRRYWKTNQGKPSKRNGYNNAIDDVLQIIDKYAEQEPCDDVVSRQAVLEIVNDIRDCISVEGYWAILERLKKLPSVRPQEQTGHWIYTGDYITDGMLKCSECGFEHDVSERFSYCPNCGARMVEQTCDTCKYNTAAFNPCNACDNKSLFEPQESEE